MPNVHLNTTIDIPKISHRSREVFGKHRLKLVFRRLDRGFLVIVPWRVSTRVTHGYPVSTAIVDPPEMLPRVQCGGQTRIPWDVEFTSNTQNWFWKNFLVRSFTGILCSPFLLRSSWWYEIMKAGICIHIYGRYMEDIWNVHRMQ